MPSTRSKTSGVMSLNLNVQFQVTIELTKSSQSIKKEQKRLRTEKMFYLNILLSGFWHLDLLKLTVFNFSSDL